MFIIRDKSTKRIIGENISRSDLSMTMESLKEYGFTPIVETAAAGSTGAGSIAVNLDTNKKGGKKPFETIRMLMNDFSSRVQNRFVPKIYTDFKLTINEAFDMDSVFSRLSSMEKSGKTDKNVGTTFGIEDDEDNIMKVTVRSDQAEQFELEVAQHLATIKASVVGMPKGKNSKSVSMAELLYDLRGKYDIIDVEFPTIPNDVIYNADKASYSVDGTQSELTAEQPDELTGDATDDMGNPLDLTDFEEPSYSDGDGKAPPEGSFEDEIKDSDSVEDFAETEPSEESMLDRVLTMMKAQAEAEIEKAKADQEKAKADQARYTAQATQFAIKDQEDQMRYELEMEVQKKKEKEAKRIADIARQKVSQTYNVRESYDGDFTVGDIVKLSSDKKQRSWKIVGIDGRNARLVDVDNPNGKIFTSVTRLKDEALRESASEVINEGDSSDSMASINAEMNAVRKKYQPNPNDSQDDIAMKRELMSSEVKELRAKMEQVAIRKKYAVRKQSEEQKNQAQQNNQQQNNDQQQNGQQQNNQQHNNGQEQNQ